MIRKEISVGNNVKNAKMWVALSEQATKFSSKISLEAGNKTANAKSLIGLLSLELQLGDKIALMADGVDEEQAISQIETYIAG